MSLTKKMNISKITFSAEYVVGKVLKKHVVLDGNLNFCCHYEVKIIKTSRTTHKGLKNLVVYIREGAIFTWLGKDTVLLHIDSWWGEQKM